MHFTPRCRIAQLRNDGIAPMVLPTYRTVLLVTIYRGGRSVGGDEEDTKALIMTTFATTRRIRGKLWLRRQLHALFRWGSMKGRLWT